GERERDEKDGERRYPERGEGSQRRRRCSSRCFPDAQHEEYPLGNRAAEHCHGRNTCPRLCQPTQPAVPAQTKRRRFSRHHGQSWPKTPGQNSAWFGMPFDHKSCENSRFFPTSVSCSPVAITQPIRESFPTHSPSMFGMNAVGQLK